MNHNLNTIEEIQERLKLLRQNAKTKSKFPQDLWDAIIQLIQIHPIEEVCLRLNINPVYLKRKICQSQKEAPLDFVEIPRQMPTNSFEMITIELSSDIGLKAKIHGSTSCLAILHSLFRG